MWPYWLLFFLPVFGAFTAKPAPVGRSGIPVGWALFGLALALMIGFRYEVGGDWGGYARHLAQVRLQSLLDALLSGDPAYMFANWVAVQADLNIWAVNLFCGTIFSLGLVKFCRQQPLPWIAAIVAVPYLIVVVAMGYSRQAVAIGLAMIALVQIRDGKAVSFLACIALAALFHKTAVLLAPIGMLVGTTNRVWTYLIGASGTIIMFYLLLDRSVDNLVSGYIEAEYQSDGAALRVAMNALPALAFIATKKRFGLSSADNRLWTIMAWCALIFIVLLVVSPSSTAVDRMALYFLPIQIFVLSRLPLAWSRTRLHSGNLQFGVIIYSAVILFVWLNFATYSTYWIPYKLYPLDRLVGYNF
jgi:EpsG family